MPSEAQILICEDNLDTADRLRELIEEEFPWAIVDVARTAKEAVTTLERASKYPYARNYCFLLVDVQLLDDEPKGRVTYVSDLPFINRLMSESNDRVVFFMSAHLTDKRVIEFRDLCNKKQSRARPMFIAKTTDEKWIEEILGWMRSFIHSQRIKAMIKDTFVDIPFFQSSPSVGSYDYAGGAGRNSGGSGDATQMVAALARDISRYWTYLDPEAQDAVQNYFKVDVEGQEIRVSM